MPLSEELSGIFVFRCCKRCGRLFTCGTMFDDALHFLVDAQERPDWQRPGQHLPYEWIEQALAYTGKASVRHRRLPAEQVVWLVVASTLYRHQSIREVVDDLDLALLDLQTPFVSKSAAFGNVPGLQVYVVQRAQRDVPEAVDVASGLNFAAFNVGIAGGAGADGLIVTKLGLMATTWIGGLIVLGALGITTVAGRLDRRDSGMAAAAIPSATSSRLVSGRS